jgi:hypothetical protein
VPEDGSNARAWSMARAAESWTDTAGHSVRSTADPGTMASSPSAHNAAAMAWKEATRADSTRRGSRRTRDADPRRETEAPASAQAAESQGQRQASLEEFAVRFLQPGTRHPSASAGAQDVEPLGGRDTGAARRNVDPAGRPCDGAGRAEAGDPWQTAGALG